MYHPPSLTEDQRAQLPEVRCVNTQVGETLGITPFTWRNTDHNCRSIGDRFQTFTRGPAELGSLTLSTGWLAMNSTALARLPLRSGALVRAFFLKALWSFLSGQVSGRGRRSCPEGRQLLSGFNACDLTRKLDIWSGPRETPRPSPRMQKSGRWVRPEP